MLRPMTEAEDTGMLSLGSGILRTCLKVYVLLQIFIAKNTLTIS